MENVNECENKPPGLADVPRKPVLDLQSMQVRPQLVLVRENALVTDFTCLSISEKPASFRHSLI